MRCRHTRAPRLRIGSRVKGAHRESQHIAFLVAKVRVQREPDLGDVLGSPADELAPRRASRCARQRGDRVVARPARAAPRHAIGQTTVRTPARIAAQHRARRTDHLVGGSIQQQQHVGEWGHAWLPGGECEFPPETLHGARRPLELDDDGVARRGRRDEGDVERVARDRQRQRRTVKLHFFDLHCRGDEKRYRTERRRGVVMNNERALGRQNAGRLVQRRDDVIARSLSAGRTLYQSHQQDSE